MQQSAKMKIQQREKEAQELRQASFYLTVNIVSLAKPKINHKRALFPSSGLKVSFSLIFCRP